MLVGFSGISLQSRPAALVYGYYTESPIVIDFDLDNLPLTNEQVYGTAGAENVSAVQPAMQAQAIPVAPSATNESAVAGAPANNTTAQNATVASNINSSVSSTKARLAAARGLNSRPRMMDQKAVPHPAVPHPAMPHPAMPLQAATMPLAALLNQLESFPAQKTLCKSHKKYDPGSNVKGIPEMD